MNFTFATAGRIRFGAGAADEVAPSASSIGQRWLVIAGSSGHGKERIVEQLECSGCTVELIQHSGEPSTGDITTYSSLVADFEPDGVLAMGGGSVIDTAKALAALSVNPGTPLDYLEVVGRGQPFAHDPLPLLAVPTTAGTGAEVTKNAVLSVDGLSQKVSLRDERLLPKHAFIDPELAMSMPPAVTAATGLDALTQVIEPYLSKFGNPMTDALSSEGLRNGAWALLRAYRDGSDLEARTAMSLTSLLGGLALANSKLGAVHGFAGPIGGRFPAPHGAICGRLLPVAFEVTARALAQRSTDDRLRAGPRQVAALLTGKLDATVEHGTGFLQQLVEDLSVPSLSTWGVDRSDVPSVVDAAMVSSSMTGNPIELTRDETVEIMERCL